MMKIKKKSKLKAELEELSAKKVTESDSVANNEIVTNGINDENKKRKKSKKHKKDINENEQPVKKPKVEIIDDPDQKVSIPIDKMPMNEGKDLSTPEEMKSNAGTSKNSKDTLLARLRNASSDFKTCTSVLHIPKHKSSTNDDSDDGDEVADITPEVRRQMRLKLQTQLKSQPRAHNRAELQERLRKKLEELRGSDKSNSKSKNKKQKLTKAEKRSKAKQDKRLKAKLSRGEQNGSLVKVPGGAKPAKPVYNSDGKMVFSKFDFTNGECAIGGGDKKKPVLDPKAALGKIQKHKEKIQSLQSIGKTEKAKSLEEKATWNSVMERTEGVKVKDDEGLLKKTIKRIDKKKKHSKKKWESRVEAEEKSKKMKQDKRTENIKKRKQDKKQNKLKKASKKGRSIPGFR